VRINSGLKKRRRKRHRHATNIDREMAVVKSNRNMPISFKAPETALTRKATNPATKRRILQAYRIYVDRNVVNVMRNDDESTFSHS